ncbi:MAG: fumarylacetoacetate hydrolase family protein [bacterium]
MKQIKFLNGKKLNAGTMFCLGQNYDKHIIEMGGNKSIEPVIFIKPPSSYLENGGSVILPDFSDNVHYEVELVLVIKEDIYKISPYEALKYVDGFSVGIDMTLRDVQKKSKDSGKPWATAKGFYTSAPIAPFVNFDKNTNLNNLDILLELNGKKMQAANTSEMIMKSEDIISYLSEVFSLQKGDLIFTGTPEGVGKVEHGDSICASVSSNGNILTEINVNIQKKSSKII